MIDRRKYNLLFMWFTILTTVLLYGFITQLGHNVERARADAFVSPLSNIRMIEVEKPVEVIVAVPVDCETEKCEIMAYIVEVFGDDADDAITLLNKCENSDLNPNAVNYNNNGTTDTGVFQINSIHGYSQEYLFDWHNNVDVAYQIFIRSGWSAWACSDHVGITPFWR